MPLGWLDYLFGMCGAKKETFAVVHEFTFYTGTCKNSEKLGKNKQFVLKYYAKGFRNIRHSSRKNVKSRTTAKVSVFAPHKPTNNLIILKAYLGTLFL